MCILSFLNVGITEIATTTEQSNTKRTDPFTSVLFSSTIAEFIISNQTYGSEKHQLHSHFIFYTQKNLLDGIKQR